MTVAVFTLKTGSVKCTEDTCNRFAEKIILRINTEVNFNCDTDTSVSRNIDINREM